MADTLKKNQTISGFYMDIDIKSNVHKNKNLPANVDEAVNLVRHNGFDPTIIVHTGNGIHVHWIFKEPVMFKDDVHRSQMEETNRRIQETIKIKAAKSNWALDSTFDLTRVLRVPGTYNRKNGGKLETKIVYKQDSQFSDNTDFDEFIVGTEQIQQTSSAPSAAEQKIILKNIVLDANAEPPADKLDWLCDIDVKFKASWQNNRDPKSFKKGKATPSEYALSLASIAVQAKWTDQEIANLIIAWNRRHGHDMQKAMRGDYIARTLAVAKKDVDEQFKADYVKNIEPTEGTEFHEQLDPEGEKTKKFLSTELGMKIFRLIKYVREKHPYYVMFTDKGQIHFRNESQLFVYRNFRLTILAQINHAVSILPRKWDGIVRKLLIIMEEEAVSESYVAGRMKEWVNAYLENKNQYNMDQTAGNREPFVHKGHWYIYQHPFSTWCYHHRSHLEGVEKTQLDLLLVGAKEIAVNPKDSNTKSGRTTRRAFKIPHNICKPQLKIVKLNLNSNMTSVDPDDDAPILH
jgi:hypothetical protein